jgi:hypothetical protein
MNDKDIMEQDILALANKYSADRIKIITLNFDRDYRRGKDHQLYLVSEKAIVRVLGKVTKVPLGENEKFSTYEEAFEATKNYWQEYYKNVRAKRSDREKLAEARRQKRYRERRKEQNKEFKQRQ